MRGLVPDQVLSEARGGSDLKRGHCPESVEIEVSEAVRRLGSRKPSGDRGLRSRLELFRAGRGPKGAGRVSVGDDLPPLH